MSDSAHDANESAEGCPCLAKFRSIEPFVWFGLTAFGVLLAITLVVLESMQRINA